MLENLDHRMVPLVAALERIPGVAVLDVNILADAELPCHMPPEQWEVTLRAERNQRGWTALGILVFGATWVHTQVAEDGSAMFVVVTVSPDVRVGGDVADLVGFAIRGFGSAEPDLLANFIVHHLSSPTT